MQKRQSTSATREAVQDGDSDRVIGVLIVDDHDGYRAVAAEVVTASVGFRLRGSASDGGQAVRFVADHGTGIDLVLLDVNLGLDDGVTLARQLTVHGADVLLVTAVHIDDLPAEARHSGARGYLSKSELSPSALRDVRDGVYDWPDVTFAGGASR